MFEKYKLKILIVGTIALLIWIYPLIKENIMQGNFMEGFKSQKGQIPPPSSITLAQTPDSTPMKRRDIIENFSQQDFTGRQDLAGLDYISADFSDATLVRTNLSNINATLAIFARTNAMNTNFQSANITNAFMPSLIATGANFSNAKMQYINAFMANFTGANLRSANLTGANLGMANLSNANLSQANFTDVNLSGVINLTQQSFNKIRYQESRPPVNIPSGLTLPTQGAY